MANHIIGLDIGGTKIRAVLAGGDKILEKVQIKTPLKNRAEFLKGLEATIGALISKLPSEEKISGIGAGIAGALDLNKGIILNAPNIKILNGFNIKGWLQKKFGCKVEIDNDARCFLRGEYLFGAGKGYENLVGITFGTGVGGGIMINGKMIYGANGSAGELGHMIIEGKKDWETLTVKQFRKSKFSKASVEEFKKNSGIGLSNIVNVLDPEAIIIGGSAAKDVGKFLPQIKTIAGKFIISSKSRKNVKILTGRLGEYAGAIGAAAIFK